MELVCAKAGFTDIFFLLFPSGLVNRYMWMQEFYPLVGSELLLFKTSVSFVDHLQELLGAIMSCCSLVVPPSQELKRNPLSVVDFMEV